VRDGPLAMVQLSSSDSGDPDAPLLLLAWVIPAEISGVFTAELTEALTAAFGPPVEGACTVGAAVAAASQPGAPAFTRASGDDDA
jgi:hypothetical protein